MTKVEAELFTDSGNDAVVRLPGRKYPAIAIQGDTLSTLVTSASDAIAALDRAAPIEARELLGELTERLQAARDRYEAALRAHGIGLPY